jgi:hypothetical protein
VDVPVVLIADVLRGAADDVRAVVDERIAEREPSPGLEVGQRQLEQGFPASDVAENTFWLM